MTYIEVAIITVVGLAVSICAIERFIAWAFWKIASDEEERQDEEE